MDVLRQLTENK